VRLSFLLLVVAVAGCESTEPRPLMWRVNTGQEPTYLFGTLHAGLRPNEIPDVVWRRLDTAAVLVTECDIREMDAGEFDELIRLPDGVSLREQVSADDWRAITHALAGLYAPDQIEHTQPWFLQSRLVRSLVPDTPEMETTFVARAEKRDSPLGFLETWQYQIRLLNDLGLRDGLKVLLEVARDEGKAESILAEWFEAYRAGDAFRLTDLVLAPDQVADRPIYYDSIVFGRTARWRVPIEAWADAGGAFIAVGFVHMLGDRGLVSLLRRDGYDVTQVSAP
jgi:uncharacterized protein